MERRLVAILAADVVGYSRLMERDEVGTMAALADRRKAVWDPLLGRNRGRVIRIIGDATLAEFTSAVDAVRCAVDIQKAMKEANTTLSDDRAIVLRIGLNLGDVIVQDGDLYGDGVNVAARLEALADPGGVLLSAAIHQQVERLLPLVFKDLGDLALKNIARPVRVYSIEFDDELEELRRTGAQSRHASSTQSQHSIAVLPFTNMSGDPDQQYFSDGITEDIITELSRFRQLLVIARNSSFQFRSLSVDLADVRRKLGVRYVVEGSVRRSVDVVRITAQLVDANTGNHLWAERYDRKSEDVFAVQDEVVRAIVATVEGRLVPSGANQALRKPTPDMSAHDYLLQGREHWNHYDAVAAEAPLRSAIDLDPNYAQAHAWLGLSLLLKSYMLDGELRLEPALACAQKGVDLDPNDSMTHAILAQILTHMRKHDAAVVHFERAIFLNPNNMFAQTLYAALMAFMGQPAAALARLELVLQRDPYPPLWYWEWCGTTLYQLRRYDDALAALHKVGLRHAWTYGYLAAAYAMAGHAEDAAEHMAAYCKLVPNNSVRKWAMFEPYKDQASLDHLLDGLRKAGLPE
jgi:TolB-like protein/class 3 adenylate cyclase